MREKYTGTYWQFMKVSNNWLLLVFAFIFGLWPTLQEVIPNGDYYLLITWFAVPLALFYNFYCWDEARKGKTS
jgi:cytochrome bd-type quinol oxidase subunit 1